MRRAVLVLVLCLLAVGAALLVRTGGSEALDPAERGAVPVARADEDAARSRSPAAPVAVGRVPQPSAPPLAEDAALRHAPDKRAAPRDVLSGTVVVVDEEGDEHPRESGRFSLVVWRGASGRSVPVAVERGSWSCALPELEDEDRLEVRDLVLGGRGALPQGDSAERLALPRSHQLTLRARWNPATVIHVRDALSGRELAPVLVVACESMLPRSHPGLEIVAAQRFDSSPVVLSAHDEREVQRTPALHLGSPDYAWARVEIDLTRPSERAFALERGGALEVELTGERPDRPAFLRLFDAGGKSVLELPLSKLGAVEVFEGLPAGRTELRAEIGEERQPLVLARVEALVVAGEQSRVVLTLASSEVPEAVSLAGTLHLPSEWEIRRPRLDFTLIGAPRRDWKGRFSVRSLHMERAAGSSEAWTWEAPLAIESGQYHVRMREIAWDGELVVPPGGMRDASIRIGPPCEVNVRCVDAETGEELRGGALSWCMRKPDGVGSWNPIEAALDPATGRWSFRAPEGELMLQHWCEDGTPMYEHVEARPGLTALELRRSSPCRFRLELRDGAALVPWDSAQRPSLATSDGQPVPSGMTWLAHGYEFDTPQPGRYRLTLPEIPGYLPVPELALELERGAVVVQEIALERRN